MARRSQATASDSYTSELGSQQRVFHPSANTYMDVDPEKAEEWTDAGWETKPGDHIDSESFPELRDTDAAVAAAAAEGKVESVEPTPTDPSQQ